MKRKTDIGAFVRQNMAWVLLIIICCIFAVTTKHFFSFTNIVNILSQSSYVIVASLGITFMMLSGEMDLSVGYAMSTCCVVVGKLLVTLELPVYLCILATLLVSVGIALINAFLADKLKLQILVVSIATMTILQGVSYMLSNSRTINNLPEAYKFIGQGTFLKIPIAVYITAVLYLIMSFVLNRTYFGRYVYALGGNIEATRLAGINVKKMRYVIAVLVGLSIGTAAIMLTSRLGSSQSLLGPGTEFTVIIGIFLGGVSIRGGEGKLSGVLAGILCISLLANGMQLINLNTYMQYVVKGVIMLTAIGFDVYQLNKKNKVKKVSHEKAMGGSEA